MWRLDNRKIYNDWQSWENYLKIKDICVFSVFGGLISAKKKSSVVILSSPKVQTSAISDRMAHTYCPERIGIW